MAVTHRKVTHRKPRRRAAPMTAPAGTTEVTYRSIPDRFFQRVAATPDARAFGYPGTAGPAWLTWAEVAERATAIAAGLRGLEVGREDRVAIMANTRLEWALADIGIMCAGEIGRASCRDGVE